MNPAAHQLPPGTGTIESRSPSTPAEPPGRLDAHGGHRPPGAEPGADHGAADEAVGADHDNRRPAALSTKGASPGYQLRTGGCGHETPLALSTQAT